jgi:hypothetical protein
MRGDKAVPLLYEKSDHPMSSPIMIKNEGCWNASEGVDIRMNIIAVVRNILANGKCDIIITMIRIVDISI